MDGHQGPGSSPTGAQGDSGMDGGTHGSVQSGTGHCKTAVSTSLAQTWWPPGSSDVTSGYVFCGSTVGHFPGAQNFPSFGCSWPKLYQARPSLDPGGVEAELVPYPAWDSDFILHSF